MSSSPQFLNTITTTGATISAANANRDGTGTIVDLCTFRATAGAAGGKVEGLIANAIGTTTAGMLRLYRKSVAGVYKLIREIPVSAIIPSGTVKTWTIPTSEGADISGYLPFANLTFQAGESLGASTHNAESFHLTPVAGEVQ